MTTGGPPDDDVSAVVVTCTGQEHRLRMRDGRVELLDHDDASLAREAALRALGATPPRCVAVRDAWEAGDVVQLPERWSALHALVQQAVADADAALLDELLDAGIDLRARDRRGRTVLHGAGRFPERSVRRVLAAGVGPDPVDRNGDTPLTLAAAAGPEWLVAALLEAGADVGHLDAQGRCALLVAAEHNELGVMHLLVEHGGARAFVPRRPPRSDGAPLEGLEGYGSVGIGTLGGMLEKQDRAASATALLLQVVREGDAELVDELVGIGLRVTPEVVLMAEASGHEAVHRVVAAHADDATRAEAHERSRMVQQFQADTPDA